MADKEDIAGRRSRLSATKREMLERMLRREAGATHVESSIPRRPDASPAPLSFAQRRLWFLHELDPDTPFYNISRKYVLRGALNVPALERALDAVVARHEALRTNFGAKDGEALQVIAPTRQLQLTLTDLSDLPETEQATEARRLMSEQARRAFDLERELLLRVSLLRLAAEEHVLVLTMHHIISDGWSMGVLFRELAALYEAFASEGPATLAPLPIQYADYAVWQRERLTGAALEEQLSYWKGQLTGARAVLELPTDRPRAAAPTHRGLRLTVPLGKPLSSALKSFSTAQGVTLFMTLVAAFKALLWRYTGQEDISVGTPVANRNQTELSELIGFFVNTLVLRTRVAGDESFRALLRDVREVCLGAYAHQELPFEKLVEELQPERDLSHTPLFQVMFALQNASAESLHLRGLEVRTEAVDAGTSIFDLTFYVEEERQDDLSVTVQYNSELFDEATIRRLITHYQRTLESCVENPDRAISDLALLTDAERRQLLFDWNRTRSEYPDTLVHKLFEARALESPQSVAVVGEGEQLTYEELDRRANRLGQHLQRMGVAPDSRVGLLLERSPLLVTAILGVHKAGGAYLPLDPLYPPQRLALMIEDAGVELLLTERRLADKLPPTNARLLFLDEEQEALERCPSTAPVCAVTADNLAYVIYTSGSTGRPKGIEVSHRGLMNLVWWHLRTCSVTASDRATLLVSVSFDASVWELWPNLASGASLHVVPDDVRSDPAHLLRWLAASGVTVCILPTPLAEAVVGETAPDGLALRYVLAGGDALRSRPPEGAPYELTNNYGPTEVSVVATCAVVSAESEGSGGRLPTIGRPIPNTRAYVLDARMRPVPVGVAGELYLGGDGLARGYLGRPDLTAERFLPDPYSGEPGARLYRTGDLARYLADGELEYLGRTDHQVKIRGFRIELGEVESALSQHPGVRECAVAAQTQAGGGGQRLVAYYVAAGGTVQAGELREHLRARLPDYMVPSAFVRLEEMPLTRSGKVDRRALPEVEDAATHPHGEYVEPRGEVEEAVASIWSGVLDVERVGVNDNFFELGGHSLLATRVVSRVRQVFKVELPLRSLFEEPTVKGLAAAIERAREAGAGASAAGRPIRRASREGRSLPLAATGESMPD